MPAIRSLGSSQRFNWATEEDPQSCSWLSSASPARWKENLWSHLSSCVLWIRFSSKISLDFSPFGVPSALSSAQHPRLGGPALVVDLLEHSPLTTLDTSPSQTFLL